MSGRFDIDDAVPWRQDSRNGHGRDDEEEDVDDLIEEEEDDDEDADDAA